MFSGGKSQYQNLLVLISNESSKLYELIRTLCLEGSFATKKYQNTFLFPNEKLIQHLKKLSDDDKEKEAIDGIRSLLLKGHFEKHQFTDSATIGTVQYGHHVLAEPEKVGKLLKPSDKRVIELRDGAVVSVVYKYDGDLPPKTVEGPATSLVPVAVGGKSEVMDEKYKIVDKFTKKLIVQGDAMLQFVISSKQ